MAASPGATVTMPPTPAATVTMPPTPGGETILVPDLPSTKSCIAALCGAHGS
eukprot:gene48722-57664_t